MAFNFPPPFHNRNSDDRLEQLNNVHPASLLQSPPNSGFTQHGTNYNPQTVSSPAYLQPRFPRWQQSTQIHMPQNAPLPELIRPSLHHPGIARSREPINFYPVHGDDELNTSDQAGKDDPLGYKIHDEMWLKSWLSRRRNNTCVHSIKEARNTLKVSQARRILKECSSSLQNLEKSYQELLAYKDKVTTQMWQEKWAHTNKIKKQVGDALANISAAGNLEAVKKTLLKRMNKRLAQKRRRSLHQLSRKKNLLKRQQMHENINAWLKNMEEVVEKAKREESLKQEADLVLCEVTRKKAEARRQISLLSVLLKLRQIRAQSSTSRGQPVSAESSARFSKVIEHLAQLWEDQLRGYNVEEQGLRVMLEEAVEERTQSYDKQAVAEWDRLLFGTKPQVKFRNFYLAAENDMEAFVTIRKCWDKYLAPPDAVMSSTIPVGWILPTNSSSSSWEKHLKPHY